MRITYQSANEMMTGRCKLRRNVGRYTRVERDGELIHLVFYNQRLVTLSPDGTIQILTGASYPSGRDRINHCLRGLGFWLCSNGAGGVQLNDGPWTDLRACYSFAEGMTIHPDRSVTGFDPETPDEKLAKHRKHKYEYSKLSSVDQIGELRLGDVVMQREAERYDYSGGYQATGIYPKLPAKNTGPYLIYKLYQSNSGQRKVSLASMDRKPLKEMRRIKLDHWRTTIKKDNFLSAVNHAKMSGAKHEQAEA